MEIGLELPDDYEIDQLAAVACTLAVAEFGPDPPYERVREVFLRLLFEGKRLDE
ncbi:hypothetical protein [Bordetella bronchiseptica]|uniref:hypothetical protein n=1 Tax=Bordetella bronchiseptica TaxID=518 RepID=UPI00137A86AC|nr:hypothetical protein [Bordetella bronchiseptica]